MYTLKLTTRVPSDRKIHLQLPVEAPQGEAEVVIRMTGAADQPAIQESLEAFFDRVDCAPRKRLSKEEIDCYIAEERASWG